MSLPDDFVFSQSSLQDYADCPRRFELRYLLGQRWPAPEVDDMLALEQQTAQGELFHHLVQQHQAGVPTALFERYITDEEVRRWFVSYLASGLTELPSRRRAEVSLTVPLGDYALTAKFDLLALDDTHAVIVDWKTTSHLPKPDALRRRWQTIVYRYVLATGGATLNNGQAIPPAQITMLYWYPQYPLEARHFAYDAAQYAHDEAQLLALVAEIDQRRDFPLTPDTTRCTYCVYRSLCNRGTFAGDFAAYEQPESTHNADFSLDLDQIAEIEF